MSSRLNQNQISAIDLFCGVGGLTNGLLQAGINVVGGFDIDADCKYAFETNNDVPFFQTDVATLSKSNLLQLWKGSTRTLLAGCAPCQPFSTYSRTRKSSDPRWSLLKSFSKLAKQTRPSVVTMENVPHLIHHQIFRTFVNNLKRSGYYVWYSILDCSTIGVPQTRKRLVLLASILGELLLDTTKKTTIRTVSDTLRKQPPLRAGEESTTDPLHRACALSEINIRRLQSSVPGGSWREWPAELKASCHRRDSGGTYPSVYGRMEWNKPAPTMTTQYFGYGNGRFGHPAQDRAISLREGAMLQTFPPEYQFEPPGERFAAHRIGRMIGNAVPPLLGKHIGEAIVEHLDRHSS